MKVRIIPDSDCCTTKETDEEGYALIEQSTYDEIKGMVKAWIDEHHGKNVAFQKGVIGIVFREDWTIEIMQLEHPLAKSEADWIEYFFCECGCAEFVKRTTQ